MYPLSTITIEHIQGFLLAHQSLVNGLCPSQGSMYVFKAYTSTLKDTTVHDTFIEEIIRELKSWSGYESELKDRHNFKKKSIAQRITDVEDLVKSADKWLMDGFIYQNKPHQSTGQCLIELISELLSNEFEIYKLQFESDFKNSGDYPWHMNLALGMEFDVFILQNHGQRIYLNFGVQIT